MTRVNNLLKKSFDKFKINLSDKNILTEAATGNYICTPILAALGGANVTAFAKESNYGSFAEIENQIYSCADSLGVSGRIRITKDLNNEDLSNIDLVTNTGFLRPINSTLISRLKSDCVIPLMWEPWEFRPKELDIDACRRKGIKVYGTNESDDRLKTMDYIGFICIFFLLKEKRTPLSTNILVIGCKKFTTPIFKILSSNNYNFETVESENKIDSKIVDKFDTIIIAEHSLNNLIVGATDDALINENILSQDHLIIHIAGNVDFGKIKSKKYPENPANFGYMSYTTDFIDPSAVFDLHAGGLKVAEGMLSAKQLNLHGVDYKNYMESNYPALAFENKVYW